MNLKSKVKLPEWVTAGAAFVYYWIISLFKLTEAPIWQDEAMEFYCSLPVKGPIRGVTDYASMYERMAYIQQQPPLYNWIMSVWLRFGEGEWWYRLSNVVLGFVAVIGLYVLVKKLCNKYAAALSVVVFSSIYIIQYYLKECSEYSLLLAVLIWGIYLFFKICEERTVSRIILFTLFCVTAVYTQYGAVFVVVPMALIILTLTIKDKDKKKTALLLGLYGVFALGAGGCLIYFFLLPQTTNSVSTLYSVGDIIIEKGSIFGDFLNSIMCVFRWCSIDMDRDWEKIGTLICIGIVVLVAITLFVVIKTKRKDIRIFFLCNAFTYILYYAVTKLNVYAYGWYGNRYNMFIFPMWFVMTAIVLYEFVNIIKNSSKEKTRTLGKAVNTLIVLGLAVYCVYGVYRVNNHWGKMDLRTVVSEWYDLEGYNVPTFVDFHQRYGFTYYFTHSEQYSEDKWDNITPNMELETYSANETWQWRELLNKDYGDTLPDMMYVVTGQWNELVDTFVELGYEVDPIVDTNAKLYCMKKIPDADR